MKKLIVCLTFAAFATLSLRAGENCTEKTASAGKAQSACCASQAKSACSSKAATAAKRATTMKGAQLLAQR
jgi:hypothetical protein